MAELSSIQSVDLNSVRVQTRSSKMLAKLSALEVGQGFEVTGQERTDVAGRVSHYAKKLNGNFATKRLGLCRTLVYRYA